MKRNYSRGEVYRSIVKLAWPSVIEQLLVMMVGIVSTIFVGRIGTQELAAVGLVGMIAVFIQTIFAGLSTGATVVVARLIGERNLELARRTLVQSLLVGLSSGVLLTAPALIFAKPILSVFFAGAAPGTFEIGFTYYSIVMFGTPFLVLDIIVAGAVRGSGDTRTPMFVTLAVNVLNVALGYALIFGIDSGGRTLVPAFGVVGAGFAVMISRMFGGILRVLVVFIKKSEIRPRLRDCFSVDFPLIGRIIRVGLPAFLEQLVMQGGFLAMQVLLISVGLVESASFQVSVNVNSFAFMPVFGLAVAATTMVGQALGRRDLEGAEILAYESNLLAVVVISTIGVLTFLFSRPLASIFSLDAAVVATCASTIRIFSLIDPFLGVMNVSAGVLRAAGDIVYVTITALVGLWFFRILISWVLVKVFGMGISGVMIGVSVDFIVRASMYGLRVRAGRWKQGRV
jgi:putative MATE family efflux protein